MRKLELHDIHINDGLMSSPVWKLGSGATVAAVAILAAVNCKTESCVGKYFQIVKRGQLFASLEEIAHIGNASVEDVIEAIDCLVKHDLAHAEVGNDDKVLLTLHLDNMPWLKLDDIEGQES